MKTQTIWDERYQAHIRVQVPGTRGYDKKWWEFAHVEDELYHLRRRAERLGAESQLRKSGARYWLGKARLAREDGMKRLAVRHMGEAALKLRFAIRLSRQVRLLMEEEVRLAKRLSVERRKERSAA